MNGNYVLSITSVIRAKISKSPLGMGTGFESVPVQKHLTIRLMGIEQFINFTRLIGAKT